MLDATEGWRTRDLVSDSKLSKLIFFRRFLSQREILMCFASLIGPRSVRERVLPVGWLRAELSKADYDVTKRRSNEKRRIELL